MIISEDIKYIGVNDRTTDLFEGQYVIPNGISYNSYLIIDDKIAVTDSVDARFADEWLENIERESKGKSPDYLVVHHMEPDHSSCIVDFMNHYPNAKIVSSAKAFAMMKDFYGNDFPERRIVVSEGDTLSLGLHKLVFVSAPMVHWPEVIVSYDSYDKIFFSADAFGKFGTTDTDEDWACEARRYYFGIVGKYGAQVQKLLKKVSAFDIDKICPLHGPVLNENVGDYIGLYNTWSSYLPESDGVVIAYTSVYGNTKKAVELLAEELEKQCCKKVVLNDLARCDMAEATEDAFRYGTLVLATTTYNADIFPFMREFINHLTERGYCNRTVAFVENGAWAPTAARVMANLTEACKNIKYAETTVTIKASLDEDSICQIKRLAAELCKTDV